MSHIVVLGSANLDLVVRTPRPAAPGETVFGESFATTPGGKGLNQAVAAARAGGDVSFIGAVGADAFGYRLRERLASDGVDTTHLRVINDVATGVAQITVTDDGENAIIVVAGANALSEMTEPERELIAGAAYLVVQLERPEALLLEALKFAREQGVTTVLTPAPARDNLDDLLSLADIIVPNAGEASALSGATDALDAARALSAGGASVVVTRGSAGAALARGGELLFEVPAVRAEAVDTTGAGDTFTGALVAWLAGGADWAEALRAASAAAAIAVTRRGAADAAPTREEIDAALAQG